MTSDLRRRWQAVFAALLIWGCANLIGSAGQAAEDDPAPASDAEAQAIAERLDAMVERAAATLRGRQAGESELVEEGADAATLRAGLEEAETQIRLLKNVVIQALRAQSAAEEALRREQAARQSGGVPEAETAPAGSQDMRLAQRVEALTSSVRQLRADVDALRSRSPGEQPPEPDRQSALRPSDAIDNPETTGDPLEEDAMLPEAGIGGRYEPWIEDEPSQSGGDAYAAVPSADAPLSPTM